VREAIPLSTIFQLQAGLAFAEWIYEGSGLPGPEHAAADHNRGRVEAIPLPTIFQFQPGLAFAEWVYEGSGSPGTEHAAADHNRGRVVLPFPPQNVWIARHEAGFYSQIDLS